MFASRLLRGTTWILAVTLGVIGIFGHVLHLATCECHHEVASDHQESAEVTSVCTHHHHHHHHGPIVAQESDDEDDGKQPAPHKSDECSVCLYLSMAGDIGTAIDVSDGDHAAERICILAHVCPEFEKPRLSPSRGPPSIV